MSEFVVGLVVVFLLMAFVNAKDFFMVCIVWIGMILGGVFLLRLIGQLVMRALTWLT